jgi:hypothetical protein
MAHPVTELEDHMLTAATARHRIRLGTGTLTDVLSGTSARVRAVGAIGATREAYRLRALRRLARLAGCLFPFALRLLTALSLARRVHILGAARAVQRPGGPTVRFITAVAAWSASGSTHGLTRPTGVDLQPG